MQPVCVFIIIVLGFIALWLLAFDSDSTDVAGEYYTSGATALDATTTLAGGGIAGPIPHNPAKMFGPRRNPAFGAYDRFLKRNASKRENFDSSNPAKTYSIDPGEIVCVRATPPLSRMLPTPLPTTASPFGGGTTPTTPPPLLDLIGPQQPVPLDTGSFFGNETADPANITDFQHSNPVDVE